MSDDISEEIAEEAFKKRKGNAPEFLLIPKNSVIPKTLDNLAYCDGLNTHARFGETKKRKKVGEAMGRRGKKRDYNGRAGDVIRFVKSHPEWSYARVGEVFGVTRQAIGQLIITEERRKGIRLHVRQNKNSKPPHLTHCLACHRAIKKLQKDQAQRVEELYPGLGSKRSYHLAQLRRAGLLKDVILFFSKRRLNAYRAWRDGMPAVEIEHRYEVPNWHSTLKQLEEECPSVGRYKRRDLRPNWQKDLEGHNIERLTKFILCGFGIIEGTGRRAPFQQSVHARSKRLAIENARVTLSRARGIKPITLRVKRWEKGINGRT